MSVQSVVRCDSYDAAALERAVERHFDALHMETVLRPNMRVVIKPNLIAAKRPETSATTHPAWIRAVAVWLHRHGIDDITLADSPGGLYTSAALDTVYSVTGMKTLSDVLTLNHDTTFESVPCPKGFSHRSFNIIHPIVHADCVINMAKLKTHTMTTLSCGIKNLFGCVPGLQKPELHYGNPDIERFSDMLLELAQTVAPCVTLIDAIDCMEGDGPTGGTSRHLGMTLASFDMFSQDWLAATCCGMNPKDVVMLRQAYERGLIHPDDMQTVGDAPVFAQPPFIMPKAHSVDFMSYVPSFLRKPARAFADKMLRPLPKVDTTKCVGCGKCAESCPPHIIRIENKKAHFTAKGCISCFCCQEMCPVKAISVQRKMRF